MKTEEAFPPTSILARFDFSFIPSSVYSRSLIPLAVLLFRKSVECDLVSYSHSNPASPLVYLLPPTLPTDEMLFFRMDVIATMDSDIAIDSPPPHTMPLGLVGPAGAQPQLVGRHRGGDSIETTAAPESDLIEHFQARCQAGRLFTSRFTLGLWQLGQ